MWFPFFFLLSFSFLSVFFLFSQNTLSLFHRSNFFFICFHLDWRLTLDGGRAKIKKCNHKNQWRRHWSKNNTIFFCVSVSRTICWTVWHSFKYFPSWKSFRCHVFFSIHFCFRLFFVLFRSIVNCQCFFILFFTVIQYNVGFFLCEFPCRLYVPPFFSIL